MLPIFFNYFVGILEELVKGHHNVVSCIPSEKWNMPHACPHNVT